MFNFNAGQNLPDGGLWYTETDPSHFIVEPFNAASALLFIGIAFWWLVQLNGKFKERAFLYIAALILMVGAIGGSIYHAFRYAAFFIFMDWLPILILCLMASTYFLFHVLKSIWLAALVVFGIVIIQIVVWNIGNTAGHNNINTNYALMALSILGPLLLFMRQHHFKDWQYIVGCFSAFLCALLFRVVDHDKWLPMGTHFLWHLFGAIACHLIFLYIYRSYQSHKLPNQ